MTQPAPSQLTPQERQEVLKTIKTVSVIPGFQKFHQQAQSASDQELVGLLNQVEEKLFNSGKSNKKNSNPVAAPVDFESSLCDAAEAGDVKKIKYLVEEKGVDVNVKDSFLVTPLISAAMKGKVLAVEQLLTYPETDINYTSNFGTNALMVAARQGSTEIVEALLADPRTNVNQHGPHGSTALHNAASFGHKDIVQLILQCPNVELSSRYTAKNLSAQDLAQKHSHPGIVAMIRQYAAQQNPASAPTPGPPQP